MCSLLCAQTSGLIKSLVIICEDCEQSYDKERQMYFIILRMFMIRILQSTAEDKSIRLLNYTVCCQATTRLLD